ncbi:hypothetical protein scyTo_0019626 [Scyliorhinus torazame]|uniref:Uncharacterized protein n=1 Tax=Scyliorhinus torazame TaxID=75743 RepID=A0A401Q394_SCYTO|nr:hypothetical protein [Scyliorhinus torazame]
MTHRQIKHSKKAGATATAVGTPDGSRFQNNYKHIRAQEHHSFHNGHRMNVARGTMVLCITLLTGCASQQPETGTMI